MRSKFQVFKFWVSDFNFWVPVSSSKFSCFRFPCSWLPQKQGKLTKIFTFLQNLATLRLQVSSFLVLNIWFPFLSSKKRDFKLLVWTETWKLEKNYYSFFKNCNINLNFSSSSSSLKFWVQRTMISSFKFQPDAKTWKFQQFSSKICYFYLNQFQVLSFQASGSWLPKEHGNFNENLQNSSKFCLFSTRLSRFQVFKFWVSDSIF